MKANWTEKKVNEIFIKIYLIKMIVKILGSASSNFHGLRYNDKKVEKENWRIDADENFPSFITKIAVRKELEIT